MGSTTKAFNFEISTPPSWVNVPESGLDQNQLEEWSTRISRLAEIGIPPAMTSIARMLLEGLNDDTSAFGAYYLDVFNDQVGEPPYVVFAMLTLVPGSLGGEDCPSMEDLAQQVRSTYGDTLTSTRVIVTDNDRQSLSTSMITKKTYGSDEDRIETEYLDMRVFIPLPEFDQIVSLLFVTPNVELEGEFRELFETIASTLRFEAAPEVELAPS